MFNNYSFKAFLPHFTLRIAHCIKKGEEMRDEMSKFQAVMSDHTLNLGDFLRNTAAYKVMFQTDAHGKERCCCHICLHVDSKKPQFLPLVIQSQSPLFHGPSTHFLHLAQRRTHALLISFKSEN